MAALDTVLAKIDACLLYTSTSGVIVLVAAAVEAEEVGHDSRAGVAGVVEAGQPERGFHRLQQREMRIVIRALHTLMAVVPIHDQHDLVRDRGLAVVVLIPHDHDRRLLPGPHRRRLDRAHQRLKLDVALLAQAAVEDVVAAEYVIKGLGRARRVRCV